MAAIPDNFGGNRAFLDDPLQAGSASVIGDMAALNLQLLHLTRAQVGPAEADRMAANLRNVLAAAEAQKAREFATRELQPMSTIPGAGGYGATNNLAGIRIQQIPTFAGSSTDRDEVFSWLRKTLRMAEAHTLTNAATINLLIHASTGAASDYIDQMREEGKGIGDIIRNLELRYGGLCIPQEALIKANTLPREPGENLSDFLHRLRNLAKMAKRNIVDGAERLQAINDIVEANLRRVLPKGIRKELDERVLARMRMGHPPFSTQDLERECVELEQRRAEYKKDQLKEQAKVALPGKVHLIRNTLKKVPASPVYRIQEDPTPTQDVEQEELSPDTSDEEAQDNLSELAGELFAGEVRRVEAKYRARGIQPDRQRVMRKAIRGFNRRQAPAPGTADPSYKRFRPKPAVAAVTSTGVSIPTSGPPNRLPESPRRPIQELLTMANCQRGDCIHCGTTGHMMTSDACPLRGKPLVDRACIKCKKGLHPVDDCLSVFQQPAKPAVAHIYDDSSDSDLNDQ